jgi:hypothetical protein
MLSPYVCITAGPSWFCRTLLFFALGASFFSQHVVPAQVWICQYVANRNELETHVGQNPEPAFQKNPHPDTI